jgi:hypothetical protein
VKVAFDGEVTTMRAPLDFRVLAEPLYLLMPQRDAAHHARYRVRTPSDRGGRMSVLLQISDPHFGTEQAEVVEALVMLARQQRPDLLVLSGDITQRARPAQFRAARAFTDRLGAPVLAVPGNHDMPLFDLWARLRRPYGRYIAAFGDDLEPVHRARPDGGVRQHHAGLAPQAWRDLRASGRPRGAAAGGCRGRRSCAWWWCTNPWP